MSRSESSAEERAALLESGYKESGEPEPLKSFMYLGFAANLAFNYLLQEIKYFEDVFGKGFGGHCGFLYACANTVGQLVLLFVGSNISFTWRIVSSSAVLSGALLCVPILTFFEYSFRLYLVYGLVVVMGLMVAMLSSAGSALTGLCSNTIRLYYTFGTCLAGLTAWPLMLFVEQLLKHVFNLHPVRQHKDIPSKAEAINCLIVIATASICFLITIPLFLVSLRQSAPVQRATAIVKTRARSESKVQGSIWSVIVPTLPMAVAVWNIMVVTFIVLPDQIVQWTPGSSRLRTENQNTYQDSMIFLFNVFDVLGRLVALRGLMASPRAVVSASFMRWLLVPLYFFASAGRLHMDNDILKVVLQGVFGGTYGYFLTCGMALGPVQPGIDAGQADTAGAAMSFAQVNGILVGALISGIARDIPRNFLNFRPYDRQCAYNDQAMFMCTDIISIPTQTTTQAP